MSIALDSLGLKKLKINFEYYSSVITLSAEPYKTIKYMKLKAIKSIFPEPINPRIYYQNRDITQYENEQVGTFFQGKNAINLRLSTIEEGTISPISNKRHTVTSLSNDSIMQQQQQQQQQQQSSCSAFITPSAISNADFACICKTDLLSFYCRNCRLLICQSCRLNIKHKTHLTIHVNVNNLEESIRLYAMIVQTDIETNIQSSQDYDTKFKHSNSLMDDNACQSIIFQKLSLLSDRYKEMMYILQSNANNNNINEIPLIVNEFNLNSKIVNGEIDNIMTEVYTLYSNSKRKMNFDQFKSYFNLINTKERDWENMTKDVLKYKLSSEINDKINRMYEKINIAIDELLDLKRPFQLEDKSLNAFNEIKMDYEKKNICNGNMKNNQVVFNDDYNEQRHAKVNNENDDSRDNYLQKKNDNRDRDRESEEKEMIIIQGVNSDDYDKDDMEYYNKNKDKTLTGIISPNKSSSHNNDSYSPKPLQLKNKEKEPIVFDEYKTSRKKKR